MIFADTTFLVDALRKKTNAIKFLQESGNEILFTSEVNVFEIYYGIHSNKHISQDKKVIESKQRATGDLIQNFQVLPLDRKAAIRSAVILGNLARTGKKIEVRDGFIAGILLSNGITKILTKNGAHFSRIEDLTIIDY